MRPAPPIPTRLLLLPLALSAAGCLLTPEIIGETITTTGNAQGVSTTSSEATTGEPTTGEPTTGDGTTGDAAGGAFGSTCQLLGFPPVINHAAISVQPACDGGICLTIIPENCDTDLDCETHVGEGSRCDQDGICTVTLALVAKHSRCTQTCETVEDCPAIPGCTTGTTCSAVIVTGDLCCEKVCLCNDDAYLPGIMSFQDICDENPEFCA